MRRISVAATRLGLNARLRARLKRGCDLGILQLICSHSRWMWLLRRQTHNLFLKRQSLNYGYFATQLPEAGHFCGMPIERAFHLATSSAPPGLSLLATQAQDRLILGTTFVPKAVSESVARQFLDTLVTDLLA